MFTTLRSKLVFSYAAVVGLFLVLVAGGSILLARDYGERVALKSLREKAALVFPLVNLELTAEQRPRNTPLLNRLHDGIRQANVRVLVVDADDMMVIDDSSVQYQAVGKTFLLDSSAGEVQRLFSGQGVQGRFKYPVEKDRFDYLARLARLSVGARQGTPGASGTPGNYIIVLAQPQVGAAQLSAGLVDFLGPAAALALLVSLAVSFLLARSISRPLQRLAVASAAIARGEYSQRLPVEGRDEIAALTAGFNEMAREVDRAHQMERDFIANVSHDLKTPLTSIQGFSQAMIEGAIAGDEGYRQAASIINSEAERMSRLVSELLTLSRLQNNLNTLGLRPGDLSALLSQVVTALQPQAVAAGVSLRLQGIGSPAYMLADEDRLKQAFGNLVDNAIKYTPRGGSVAVNLIRNGDLRVSVTDTGAGIPADDLPRVMERFYQVDKSRRTADGRSAGLGLTIAREIARAHHGDIAISSVPGRGTTVEVRLPQARDTRGPSRGTGILSRHNGHK